MRTSEYAKLIESLVGRSAVGRIRSKNLRKRSHTIQSQKLDEADRLKKAFLPTPLKDEERVFHDMNMGFRCFWEEDHVLLLILKKQ